MNDPAEELTSKKRHAIFVVARIRMRRRLALRHFLADLVVTGSVSGLAVLSWMAKDPLYRLKTYFGEIILVSGALFFAVAATAAFWLLKLGLEQMLALFFRHWGFLPFLAERGITRELLSGKPVRERGPLRRKALETILEEERELIRTADGIILREHGIRESCLTCGAPLHFRGPGLRVCRHCELERYEPLPKRGANENIGSERDWEASAWAAFKAHLLGHRVFVLGMVPVALSAALAIMGALSRDLDPDFSAGVLYMASPPFFIGLFASGFPFFAAVTFLLKEWVPGARAYSLALADAVCAVLRSQGQITIDEAASCLGVPARHILVVLNELQGTGDLPFYYDQHSRRLLCRYAEELGTSQCSTCGARLVLTSDRSAACRSCGTITEW